MLASMTRFSAASGQPHGALAFSPQHAWQPQRAGRTALERDHALEHRRHCRPRRELRRDGPRRGALALIHRLLSTHQRSVSTSMVTSDPSSICEAYLRLGDVELVRVLSCHRPHAASARRPPSARGEGKRPRTARHREREQHRQEHEPARDLHGVQWKRGARGGGQAGGQESCFVVACVSIRTNEPSAAADQHTEGKMFEEVIGPIV